MISVKEVLLSDLWSGTYQQGHDGMVHLQARRKFTERGKINDFSKWVSFKYIDGLYRKHKGVSIKESTRWSQKY